MANLSDFWGKKDGEKRTKKSALKDSAKIFYGRVTKLGRFLNAKMSPVFKVIGSFFRRVFRLPKVLNKIDKIALLILFVIFLGLTGYKVNKDVLSKTKKVPTVGGTYEEVLIGEAKYLNPVLAKTDTDRTINRLIYSGLTRINDLGAIQPDLAESYEISPDGKIYTFHLRSDVSWQDGAPFSSADVAATIASIKDSSIKSPYFESWKDVQVEAPDEKTVVFSLANPYGPFIYNTLVGIIPSHQDSASISASPLGTGPYKFTKANSGKNNAITEVIIERSELYYQQRPYIKNVEFHIAKDESEAVGFFNRSSIDAIAGLAIEDDKNKSYSYPTSRHFGIVFNLANDKLKDLALRKKIVAKEKLDPFISVQLLTLDKPLSVAAAENIAKEYQPLGVEIKINKKSAIDYQELIAKRNFELVLYGFDWGYDRDPYPFWHSSQIATGNNFSGFSNKSADILLEDARMTTDSAVRNQKYDQFYSIVNDQAVGVILPSEMFKFTTKKQVQGISSVIGYEPWDHLNSFSNWYLKTKRVKP